MLKKIIWLVVAVIIILLAGYFKVYYPGSQLQLKRSFKYVSVIPVEHFYNATENSCGIWYEQNSGDIVNSGRTNDKAKECFKDAFDYCECKNILLVKDSGETSEKTVYYSLLRIIKQNDAQECIIQNYQEEHDLADSGQNVIPLNYINTCTVLADDFFGSCEPLYVKEMRDKKNEEKAQEQENNENETEK